MNKSIKELLRFYLGKIYRWINFSFRALRQFITSVPRLMGMSDARFSKLRSYKNKYKGKRCFITCTGPSLTISDLELLRNEYTFGMNSICLIHDKTDWKPDFFGIQDKAVFDKVRDALLATDNGVVFAPFSYKKKYNTPDNWVYFAMHGAYHLYSVYYSVKPFARFSGNSYARVFDGYSISYSILQLAYYMGFDEIYFLGADCNYLGEKQHFIEHGNYDPQAYKMGERLEASYTAARNYCDKRGVRIFNVTRGGCLEVYPRKTLEEVLAKNEKNKISD